MKSLVPRILLGAACFHVAAALRANDTAVEKDVMADCRLTVTARQALQHEITLTTYNLGVTVQNRVATMWGVIDSAELSRRAEETLRMVPGIASVKNDLRVERSPQAGKPQLVQTWSPAKMDSPPMAKQRAVDNFTRFTGWAPPEAVSHPVVSLGAPVFREPINLKSLLSTWWP